MLAPRKGVGVGWGGTQETKPCFEASRVASLGLRRVCFRFSPQQSLRSMGEPECGGYPGAVTSFDCSGHAPVTSKHSSTAPTPTPTATFFPFRFGLTGRPGSPFPRRLPWSCRSFLDSGAARD